MDTTIKPGDDFFSYNAYKLSLEGKEAPKPIDGFTDYQRFFLSYA
jgi:putative endopeptidase